MTKSIFASIVGRPNVGKSSLLNVFLGEKIAIVSPRPQTTRTKITGILTKEETQIVFFDTPGIHTPKNKLSQHMVNKINESVGEVDLNLMVIEAKKPLNKVETDLIEQFKKSRSPVILVINKIDQITNKEQLLTQIKELKDLYDFKSIVPISVIKKQGTEQLLEEVTKLAIEGPHFFPDDDITDQPEKVIVAEIVREKLLKYMYDEIPHGIAVEIEKMRHREDGKVLEIDCIIYCEKSSHKGMVIGKKGAMLKKIATESRIDAERFLDEKIHMQCWVKVKDDWRNKETFIKNFGLNS